MKTHVRDSKILEGYRVRTMGSVGEQGGQMIVSW